VVCECPDRDNSALVQSSTSTAVHVHENPSLNPMPQRCTRCIHRVGRRPQRSPLGVSRESPTDHGDCCESPDRHRRNVLPGCRMMHPMQFRALRPGWPACGAADGRVALPIPAVSASAAALWSRGGG
jgi:hypothetical protein